MSRIFLSLGVLGLASVVAAGMGCGDEHPAASEAEGFAARFEPVGSADAGSVTDAASAVGCTGLSVDAAGVSETFVNAETPPDPLGGELPSGTFVLTDITRFESWSNARDSDDQYIHPPPSSDLLEAKMLVVDGATFRFAVRTGTLAAGLGTDVEITGGTFATRGASVALSQACPARTALTLGFTGIGGSISIYTDPKRRETYAPLPP